MKLRREMKRIALFAGSLLLIAGVCNANTAAEKALKEMGVRKGVCVVVGLPKSPSGFVNGLAEASELLIYFQSPDENEVMTVRRAAVEAGLLGERIFADRGEWNSIHLADNLASAMWIAPSAQGSAKLSQEEILRVLHPDGKAILEKVGKNETIVKAFPAGIDSWSHPYHGPDNNPQSADSVARHPYLTQFLGYPLFGCISEVTVGSRGRLYRAFGNIAMKTAHNEVLNKLYCINAYNGTIQWKRDLKEGFMIHRSAMIAAPDALYLADDESCKVIDALSGKVSDEIIPDPKLTEGTVWKWMAMENGTLYALIGGEETKAEVKRATKEGFGHWPWGMWQGYDYSGGDKAFGFGRNFVAIDPGTKKILWHHREQELLDSRGICMKDGRIYCYSPGKFLTCLDAKTGKSIWERSAIELIEAIGPQGRAQIYVTGFSSSAYIKTDGRHIILAGPQRPNLVAISCKDGNVVWHKKGGNFQVVLRPDALYAIGPQKTGNPRKVQNKQESISYKIDYVTGEILNEFTHRRACTRATGSYDSIYFRASGGTIRYDPVSDSVEHIAPMRPPCHDGVIISDGMLHWGPWICGCHLSLYGSIGLAPAGNFEFTRQADEQLQLETGLGGIQNVKKLTGEPRTENNYVICGDTSFSAGKDGIITARSTSSGREVWKAYTGGGINFPPVVWKNRVFAGSNDGWVHAYEATTGRLLWRFRAAPVERRINVYGKLMSTWPVAGGVAVSDGVVYAAAGIAHYDGTHVYALDATTGKIKWHNNTSGAISDFKNGISLQGQLQIKDDKLTFCGGNVYPEAVFDLATGKCLNNAEGPVGKKPSTFYAVDDYLEKVKAREAQRGKK